MESIESVSRWRHWGMHGIGDTLARLIDVLDSNLPAGWRRLNGNELAPFQSLVNPGSAWYTVGETCSHVGVALSLERLGDSELRGGRVCFAAQPAKAPAASFAAAWDQVMRFLDEGLLPAAQRAGVAVRMPTPQTVFLSELPTDVRDRLCAFSQTARKSFPLTQQEADLWRGFVIAAFRTEAVIDPVQFVDWLIAAGWSREAAQELSLRFYDQCILLSRYADEVSAA